ncbi:MAG: histidinol-phosphate transaminase [candidate division NC10 bacterium RIFCSPLOWO2_12_FULL_66_18]|nr:MAG: histidinol-phosphate transaminase [candidate division NC10 bacterium RIFCSPLOWO2_12_FULL_66_18]
MTRSLEDLASPYLRGLIPYSPGKPIEEVERELGISNSVKLASNENALGPSPLALQALREALPGIHRYPDGSGHSLRQALGRHWDVAPELVILGNGSNELLELAGRCFLLPGDEAVYAEQAFIVYDLVAQVTGAAKVRVPLTNFTHDLDAIRAALSPRTKLVFIGNPNNPTGTAVPARALEAFLESVPSEVLVILDEAYYEYLPPELIPDALRFVRAGRLVLVLRTFSKIYGLAGLRIGYGIGPAPLVGLLNRAREPFNTNSLAQAAATAALSDEQHVASTRAITETGRKFLTEQCRALGLRVVPSVANFLLVDVGRPGPATADALLRHGVIVRPMAGYGFPTHLRISVGTPPENERCIAALKAVLGK